MGTIIPRRRKDGSTGYMAQISMRRDGHVHPETKTFDRNQAASAWLEKRERELERPGAINFDRKIHILPEVIRGGAATSCSSEKPKMDL
ncbi:hypothetical protein SS37A_13550 [Methylocystis iwaonis]|uniref:Integrase n=1 Tax=Methylocystis iwaonis TaxID=2885079 RepID=A0ABM8E7G5_9HYPH|nr:hypothetical protein SS37A_13550 [Methylocystis iwaonis]